ncbi:oligosaccharyl transferase, archaeosortase A system-associated [Natrinema versiforme]|uniref:dolichyl-phosphooligosaccharide-protein glycotransferase n=1 Tax=Natrinema versiforme JCM 10478 TaxID=1227496 RepID=L9Y162_9EURY|nr:oligosaccharyl transferase, archaeosortase A system-associated [Natrinema versiforme]ELY67447.1 Oligosaccharyl transferase STT3 subunit [Natrinema versiforme JCM 10478]
MSTDTEHVEDGTETSLLESVRDWYHLPVIGLVMLFMVWLRTQAYDQFVTEDGTPALAGIDSWYQWRTISWTAENYPQTMPYEVWTGFPSGNYVGQFGTLFDQLIVTAAMIVGLGDPSTETLYAVSLLAIPVMAALVAIPVFYAGRRLGGTLGGIVSVLVLALAKGQFLSRSTVGQLDHHVGEVLFMAIAVLSMMVALTVAEREKPIYELVVDRDWETLRSPALYSGLAGLALTLYIWVWPSAVLLIGILGVFFTVQLCLDYLRGVSPDHVAFVGAVSLGVTAILTVLLMEQPGNTGSTSFGLLQPLTALLVAVGCVFMAWLARQWNNRGLERRYYPLAIGGLIGAVLVVMWLALPSLFDTIIGNATRRMLPFGGATTDLTIQEAQPPENYFDSVFREFGSAFYTMLAGLAFLTIRPLLGRKLRAEHTLVIVWSLFLISMSATQVRFSYYLMLAVAVVNAAFVAELVGLFDLDLTGSLESLRSVETYQVIVVVLVVLLLFAPLLPPLASATAWGSTEGAQPSGSAIIWEGSNEWLQDNTPAPGNYGDANNAGELDYYGTYTPGDGDYEYPDGAYGVMSWWDYGHLITTQGERIPHSNPFQQNARSSSAFLTAESEQRGELILDAIAAGESVSEQSNDELRTLADGNETGEEMRYVMIDDQMAGGKFGAITRWTGPSYNHYVTPEDYEAGQQISRDELASTFSDVPYDDTMLSSLYFDDATGMDHYRLVHENDIRTSAYVSYAIVNPQTDQVLLDENGQPQVGINRAWNQQTQAQLQRVQQSSQYDVEIFDQKQAAGVKTYERVDGATITGSVDEGSVNDIDNATVAASVELETGTSRTFNYTQRTDVADDGSYELTVPYATNDELSVEDGYTNSSVEATGDYNVSVIAPGEQGFPAVQYRGQTDVPETAVVNGETVDDVSLEEVESEEPAGNETGGNESTGNESETASGDSGSTDDSTSGNETTASLTPAAAEPTH